MRRTSLSVSLSFSLSLYCLSSDKENKSDMDSDASDWIQTNNLLVLEQLWNILAQNF